MSGPNTKIRVAIIDDHTLILEAMKVWIQTADPDIEVVAISSDWARMMSNPLFPEWIDVIVMDVDLKDGLPLSVKLHSILNSGPAVVLVSAIHDLGVIRSALDAGASSYVLKNEPPETMVKAIRQASEGESWMSEDTSKMMAALHYGATSIPPRLTIREQTVMAMYAQGSPIKEVARTLTISDETVKSYVRRIRFKYLSNGIDIGTKVALRKRAHYDGIITELHD